MPADVRPSVYPLIGSMQVLAPGVQHSVLTPAPFGQGPALLRCCDGLPSRGGRLKASEAKGLAGYRSTDAQGADTPADGPGAEILSFTGAA